MWGFAIRWLCDFSAWPCLAKIQLLFCTSLDCSQSILYLIVKKLVIPTSLVPNDSSLHDHLFLPYSLVYRYLLSRAASESHNSPSLSYSLPLLTFSPWGTCSVLRASTIGGGHKSGPQVARIFQASWGRSGKQAGTKFSKPGHNFWPTPVLWLVPPGEMPKKDE